MKKLIFPIIAFALLFSSCGIHQGMTTNMNNHVTSVELSEKNYTVVSRVQGEAEATYILGFGGLKKNGLVAEARANMLKNADIVGSSRAIVNETIEFKTSIYVVFGRYKVVASAHVVEFTD